MWIVPGALAPFVVYSQLFRHDREDFCADASPPFWASKSSPFDGVDLIWLHPSTCRIRPRPFHIATEGEEGFRRRSTDGRCRVQADGDAKKKESPPLVPYLVYKGR